MGKFDAVNAVEKTTVHPWFIDYGASKITPAGASLNKGGRLLVCVIATISLRGQTSILKAKRN